MPALGYNASHPSTMATFPTEYEEQHAHQRLREWMQQHGWSSVINADPAEILEYVQQHGDEADISLINNDDDKD